MFRTYLIFHLSLILLLQVSWQLCSNPQKGLYMSFDAISKRDSLPNLFIEVSNKTKTYDTNYTNEQITYAVIDLLPQFYYNEHHQKQEFMDEQRVQVTLGDIEFAFKFNFEIVDEKVNSTTSGWARGRVLLEQQRTFVKTLYSNQGELEWQPEQIQELKLVLPLSIEYSSQNLTSQQITTFNQILNGHLGQDKLKQVIIKDLNENYQQILKEHLNNEDLVNDLMIDYKFGNVNISYINLWRNFSLSSNQPKGLQAMYNLEVNDSTANCSGADISFDMENGGLQEVIAISQLGSGFVKGLQEGLFDVDLNHSYEVPEFQFYMGDLTRAFSAAYNYDPSDEFTVKCSWDKDEKFVKVNSYPNNQLYATLVEVCTVKHDTKNLFELTFDLSFSAVVRPQSTTLDIIIKGANNFQPIVKPIDPEFKVTDMIAARNAVSVVLQGMIGQKAFGSGWPTYKRKFPAVKIKPQFLVIFDPSQP